ncbi:MAG: glycosyltransferase family 4 protein [Anaerolineae bacterium]|jgi:glycosyltransferase involved in cell wall biosynthesis
MTTQAGLKIAFVGQKGIPAHFGGIEFHVDELARHLVRRGHQVTVYVRSWYTPREVVEYEGVRLVHTPTIRTKHLDASLHSLTSSLHACLQDYDVVHYHALGPSFFAWPPRLRGQRVVVTIHALDWQRPKWGRGARTFLKLTERSALYLPHGTVVVSRALQHYFEEKYGRPVHYIPNGVHVEPLTPPALITERYGLVGDDYLLFLARLVPEKRVDWLIRAFLQIQTPLRLVVAGDAEGDGSYGRRLHELASGTDRVVFTGTVGGRLKEELFSNARLYVTPSGVEGLPISLLEAMAHKRCCLASDIPAHAEVIRAEEDGLLFQWDDFEQLVAALQACLDRSEGERCALGEAARQRVQEHYDWQRIAESTERFYHLLLGHKDEDLAG